MRLRCTRAGITSHARNHMDVVRTLLGIRSGKYYGPPPYRFLAPFLQTHPSTVFRPHDRRIELLAVYFPPGRKVLTHLPAPTFPSISATWGENSNATARQLGRSEVAYAGRSRLRAARFDLFLKAWRASRRYFLAGLRQAAFR